MSESTASRGSATADRVREALLRGAAKRLPGASRGVSYAGSDVASRLRRVAALRRTCLELRKARAVSSLGASAVRASEDGDGASSAARDASDLEEFERRRAEPTVAFETVVAALTRRGRL